MVKLSAFADEVTDDFIGQIKFLAEQKINYIELRFVNKKNIMELNKDELNDAQKILKDNGIKVNAIGSPIGKITIDKPFAPHLDKFKHAVELANLFETRLIRIFSYYAPEGKSIAAYRNEVMDRMALKLEILQSSDIIMVHENEAHIYGQTAEHCADLAKTMNSPKFRLVYDPANFVCSQKTKENVKTCWPLMKPYVSHIHIKDWKVGADIGSIPGTGDAQIKELLEELKKMKYEGFMTMEPHLMKGGQFGGSTGPKLFAEAIASVRKICMDIELVCK